METKASATTRFYDASLSLDSYSWSSLRFISWRTKQYHCPISVDLSNTNVIRTINTSANGNMHRDMISKEHGPLK